MQPEESKLNLPKKEGEILKFWEEHHIFEKTLEKTKDGQPFTFYDGPPFATGLPHYGHVLASTIKDVIPRYQTMRGRYVRRRWGWDCHGLPIEEIVERKLGISGKKQIEETIGIAKFIETCRGTVLTYVHEWGKMVRRIARWTEFENSYKTMDTDYMESVWWAFKELYKKKLAYEGRRVLLYCPRCETPVSNFEVAMDDSYSTVTEEAVTVRFKVKPASKEWDKTVILSWTTTPWTLPGNVALTVNADETYVRIPDPQVKGQWVVLGEKRFRDLVEEHKFPPQYRSSLMLDDIDTFKGKDMIGVEYEPLYPIRELASEKSYRVYHGDFVTMDEGTGVVHTAVVYGEEDYALGVREGLPVVPLLDGKGVFNELAPEFLRGVYFKDSEKLIKDDLKNREFLFTKEQHSHSYPFCWRCGTTLFYNAIPAWFVAVDALRATILESNEEGVQWFPEHLKHGRYQKSVESAPDWNISRNRYWGNPIPVWRCEECKHEQVVGSIKELANSAPKSNNRYLAMRHGDAETLMLGVVSDSSEYHLTDKGKEKTKRKTHALGKLEIDVIVASPVGRAKETANIVGGALGVQVKFDERLREIDFGEFDGKPDAEYNAFFASERERFEKRPEGGESLGDLQKRVVECIYDFEREYEKKTILLVSHADPIWILWGASQGLSREALIEANSGEGEFLLPDEVVEVTFKRLPRNADGEVDLHRPYVDEVVLRCEKCGRDARRISEIFDSWTEAGSMPFAEHHYPFEHEDVFKARFPAQFVAEYIAQTRAWFYTMHVMSVALFGKAPFENVVTTGTILAEDGAKMSKSKGNYPDPWIVLEKYGADSLRFYLMHSVVMQAENLNFNVRDLETIHRKVPLILLNSLNYFLTYADERVLQEPFDDSQKTLLDRWVDVKTQQLIDSVTTELDRYDTVRATRAIIDYVDDLSRWYVRRSRGRTDASFFHTFRDALLVAVKVVAPFMPYTAEIMYRELVKFLPGAHPESVHLTDWPKADKRIIDTKLIDAMDAVRHLASLALAERAKAGIKVRQPLAALRIKSKELEGLLDLLKDEVNVKEVIVDATMKQELELDTALAPELIEEGLIRELIRNIQEMRRDAGMHPRDSIRVSLAGEAPLPDLLSHWQERIKSEVGAEHIEQVSGVKATIIRDAKIGNLTVSIGVTKQ